MPHASEFSNILIKWFKKCRDQKCKCDEKKTKQLLQEDYENLYIGPQMDISRRYSQILAQMFIVLTFSSGMPLLYPIGMACVFVTYWVDKWLFIRFQSIPPMWDGQMSMAARRALKFAIIIHCVMSIYIYSNEDIFSYEEVSAESKFGKLNKNVDKLILYFTGIKLRKIAEDIDEIEGLDPYVTFSTGHIILYCLGLFLILIIAILEEVFGFLTYLGECLQFVFRIDRPVASPRTVKKSPAYPKPPKQNQVGPLLDLPQTATLANNGSEPILNNLN